MPVDVLILICSKLDNRELEKLAQTRLWTSISTFARSSRFWHARVENVVGHHLDLGLAHRAVEWKRAYYCLVNPGRFNELSIRVLLDIGYDPAQRDQQLLSIAVECGFTSIVRLLLNDKRVCLTCRGATPLERACRRKRTAIVRLLLTAVRSANSMLEDGRVGIQNRRDSYMLQACMVRQYRILQLIRDWE